MLVESQKVQIFVFYKQQNNSMLNKNNEYYIIFNFIIINIKDVYMYIY